MMYGFLTTSLVLLLVGITNLFQDDVFLTMVEEKVIKIKDRIMPYIANIGFNLLYCFSVCQIQMNKLKQLVTPYIKKVNQYLKDNNIIVEVKTQIIEIITKSGDTEHKLIIIDKTPVMEFANIFDPDRHIGVVLSDKNFESGCINKIYREKFEDDIRDYKLSKINFMMIELAYENNKYPIVLKNDTYNYYIVNNSLNQNFFKYYLKNVLNVAINEDNFHYTVTIIDHNVNMLTLLPNQHIVFDEHNYTIHPIKNNDLDSSNPTLLTNTDNISIDEHSNSDTDKSDDFVKLDGEY